MQVVSPKPAASLILMRQHRDGLEALIGRRRNSLRFMPGMSVFPGGRVDPADHEITLQLDGGLPGTIAGGEELQPDRLHTGLVAALRECWEETGGLPLGLDKPPAADRPAVRVSEMVRCIGRAVTPRESPIRFDTLFYLADGATTRFTGHPCGELETVGWVPVEQLLGAEHLLADVTEFMLREAIAAWPDFPDLPVPAVVPRYTYANGRPVVDR